jgi:transcription antitermination protein NusB
MNRREVRDCAFKIIFESLLRDDTIEELYEIANEIEEITVNDKVKEIVEGVVNNAEKLDELIIKFSPKRNINRISKINLAILKIAFYEILFDELTPTNVAINEAVQLAKTYSQSEDVAFVNGLLGTYSREQV